MKIMRVGDPHIQVSNLKDSRSLMEFVMKTAMENVINLDVPLRINLSVSADLGKV